MADIKDRAREYLSEHSEYSEVFGKTFVAVDTLTAMVEFTEQETKELKAECDLAIEGRDVKIKELETRCNELFLQTCEQAEKIKELKAEIENDRDLPAIAYMQGAEKQKKKDEEELKKWKDEWQEQVQKATDEGYARTLQTMQLNKAKDILQRLMENQPTPSSMYAEIDLVGWREVNKEAEQFLNEVEK